LGIYGADSATLRESFFGCLGAVFSCNFGAILGAFLVQLLLLSGIVSAAVLGQFLAVI
jgi:hypothetical protein